MLFRLKDFRKRKDSNRREGKKRPASLDDSIDVAVLESNEDDVRSNDTALRGSRVPSSEISRHKLEPGAVIETALSDVH